MEFELQKCCSLARYVRLFLLYALTSISAAIATPGFAEFPGGFVENNGSLGVRPPLTASQIQALLPTRGKFTFPAPYNTEAVRITNASDCGGADCVDYAGYSYWRNINNHVGSDTMFIFVGLIKARGGGGPTLFSYNKNTDELVKVGPLFEANIPFSSASGEGWYFSASQPTKLYVNIPVSSSLQRYDVVTHTFETVFDVATRSDLFGTNRYIWQFHSSDDDTVHSATLRDRGSFAMLGCVVYQEDAREFSFYAKTGDFDECQIDKSGRWLLIKENVDGVAGEDNRIIDLDTGVQRVLLDQDGAAGHSDMGYGYMVAGDNWDNQSSAQKLWKFTDDPLQGTRVYYNFDWSVAAPAHVSHSNAQPGVPPEQQYACGSSANRNNSAHANEVICFRLDTSLDVLVVAPVMTDLDAPGGGNNYAKLPKGNLDVTGQYFLWTSNMGGNRLDAFLVKVPSQRLTGASDTTPPTVAVTSPLNGATVSGATGVSANATDNVGIAGVQFKLNGVNLGAEDTTAPYTVSWNTATTAAGSHTLAAVARDAAGNSTTSSAVTVTVLADTAAPVISSVSVPNVSSSAAVVAWTTNEPSDSLVEYGPTTAYGSVSPFDSTMLTAHAVTLGGLTPDTLYHYRVKSRDAAGNPATSADFTFTTLVSLVDITSPTVSVTQPVSGATVAGTITVSANAFDDVGVAGVRFTLDGAPLNAEVTQAPYAISWNTGSAANGTHTLTATARDVAGNSTTSTAVTITVGNTASPLPEMVGHWKLDDGSGTTAADASGNGNSGTLVNGPAWTAGRLGQALAFDGVDDSVQIAHAATLNNYPLTVAFWLKTDDATGLHGIVNKYLPSSLNGYQVFVNNGNLCAWYFRDASNYVWDGTACTLSTPGVADNQWHHVAFVVDAAGGRLYVDGVQKTARVWTGTAGGPSTVQNLSLGQYPGTAQPYFSGVLDDVRIYPRALSAAEAAGLANVASSGPQKVVWTNLVNLTATGNSLQKTGGCDGCEDAGAISQEQIGSGDGYLEFTVSETNLIRFVGLNNNSAGTSSAEIPFAFKLSSGYAEVREKGQYLSDTPVVTGDVLRIAVKSGVVQYSKNGAAFYTSTVAPTYPLRADTSFSSANGTISDAVVATGQ
jgi:hypothetical protein